ncbi:MAG: glycolate oxidase subunit GlcF [Gammaproteobacteria bacterium]
MQTFISESTSQTTYGKEAERILRSCVHCGFCNASCPTYQLLGDELDGPRGRIYLIKQVLEGSIPSRSTQLHLDRCLTCRACETTCPSGVQYGRLLDIGRALTDAQVPRAPLDRLFRRVLRYVLPYTNRFRRLMQAGQAIRPLLPRRWRDEIPPRQSATSAPAKDHERIMLLLEGCVQPVLRPQINASATRVLDRLQILLRSVNNSGCCGALSHHLGAGQEAKSFMRRNIDAWWPHVQDGAEAIVVTATGCTTMVKEYGHLLRDDPDYQHKAQRISELTRDLSEVVTAGNIGAWSRPSSIPARIAFHSPCTLQHGLGLDGTVESLLTRLGFDLTHVPNGHSCCGSAGTFSLLQRDLSRQLRDNKLTALQAGQPQQIITANIGCLTHLMAGAKVPVGHWIELVDSVTEH